MRIKVCGITTLEDAEEAQRLGAWGIGLNHHPESPRFVASDVAAEIARRTGAKVIRAFPVRSNADIQASVPYRTDFHLFDAHARDRRGGTGQTFDWELVRGHDPSIPVMVAGGLRPGNVAEAIEIAR